MVILSVLGMDGGVQEVKISRKKYLLLKITGEVFYEWQKLVGWVDWIPVYLGKCKRHGYYLCHLRGRGHMLCHNCNEEFNRRTYTAPI